MEMEMEVTPASEAGVLTGIEAALDRVAARLAAAAALLESAAGRFTELDLSAASRVPADARDLTCLSALEEKLAAAEATIASLRADAAATKRSGANGFNTVSRLVAKHSASPAEAEPGALDAALRSLSLEQRIAVKSELLRAGLLT